MHVFFARWTAEEELIYPAKFGSLASLNAVFFSPLPYYPLPSCQIFLPLIFRPTGFHDWGLVARWAQLQITTKYYLPSTLKDQITMSILKAVLTSVNHTGPRSAA